ncbi:hypothetical protein Catovirus_1_432 [Catovirus CTV1]|uniref:Calcineurin-like phosphoesterase domain-containing protein n=1 Tax=Catovirus CTV1 TaxID=1977631 RepID=A0A1V0S9K2_9VIRU|nr:hypothetical protein Catovirus_1_432 [Catovirus CTV1]
MVKFIVTGDIQVGNPSQEVNKRGFLESCNKISPKFVIHAGDITDLGENGNLINYLWYVMANNCWYPCLQKPHKKGWGFYPPKQLTEYKEKFVDKLSKDIELLECLGNHDLYSYPIQPVKKYITSKFGNTYYKKQYGSLSVYSLDVYPNKEISDWLYQNISENKNAPYVCFFHYPITGPLSDWWKEEEKEYFYNKIKGSNCLALYVGHTHGSAMYRYHEFEQYDGSGDSFWFVEYDDETQKINHTQLYNIQ